MICTYLGSALGDIAMATVGERGSRGVRPFEDVYDPERPGVYEIVERDDNGCLSVVATVRYRNRWLASTICVLLNNEWNECVSDGRTFPPFIEVDRVGTEA